MQVAVAVSVSSWFALAADAADDVALEEVTVTARKVTERLQETPVAVSAFTGEALEKRSIGSSSDVLAFVPNVNFGGGYSGSADGFFYIRGVGVNDFTAALDPPVGVYVDGVFLGRTSGALFDLVDVERIEVLRGPQGTLFGRNTSGGAISFISRRPEPEWSGRVAVAGGQRDLLSARASIEGPLGSEAVAGRLTVLKRQQDGWVKRVSDGRTLGDVDTTAARLAIDWQPSDSVSVLLAGDWSDSDNSPYPQVLAGVAPNSVSPCPPFCIPLPADLGRYVSNDPEATNAAQPLVNEIRTTGGALTVEWDLGAAQFKSITAYRTVDQSVWADYDASPYMFYDDEIPLEQSQFSQELQLAGGNAERFRWLVGAFYFDEEVDQTNAITLGATGPRGVLRAPVLVPPFPGGPPILPVAPLVVDPPAPLDRRYRIVSRQRILPNTESYAVFGQADLRLTERLGATLGLRWSKDRKQQGYDFVIDNTIPNHPLYPVGRTPSLATTAEDDWSSVDPRVGLDWRFSPDVTAYVSYSSGFRAGGFNSRPVVPPIEKFDPEEVRSIEAGLKSEWLDRRLRVNAAAFTTDYQDLQIGVLAGGFFSIANAGDATIDGFELEVSARPVPQLELNAALGFLDAGYESLSAEAAASGVRLDGDLPMSPEWTATLGAQYAWELGAAGSLSLRADWSYVAERRTYANDAPGNLLGAHDVVNARLTWSSANETWSVAATVRNAFDEQYLNWAEDVRTTASPLGVWGIYPAPPREWAVEAAYRF
jgi:iron complex outermembrane receptor protein